MNLSANEMAQLGHHIKDHPAIADRVARLLAGDAPCLADVASVREHIAQVEATCGHSCSLLERLIGDES